MLKCKKKLIESIWLFFILIIKGNLSIIYDSFWRSIKNYLCRLHIYFNFIFNEFAIILIFTLFSYFLRFFQIWKSMTLQLHIGIVLIDFIRTILYLILIRCASKILLFLFSFYFFFIFVQFLDCINLIKFFFFFLISQNTSFVP